MHERNQGKGAAIRTAAAAATGDYVIMCDADLEYSPAEIPSLLAPVIAGDAEVVYGTRTFGSHNAYSYAYVLGNKGVTTFANMLFNCYISDLETCFKLIPAALYRELGIRSRPASAWKPRSPGSCCGGASGPTRCRSAIRRAPAKRERSSPGATASRRCGSCSGNDSPRGAADRLSPIGSSPSRGSDRAGAAVSLRLESCREPSEGMAHVEFVQHRRPRWHHGRGDHLSRRQRRRDSRLRGPAGQRRAGARGRRRAPHARLGRVLPGVLPSGSRGTATA